MLTFLPAPLLGIIATLLYVINTLFWAALLFITALFKVIPIPA